MKYQLENLDGVEESVKQLYEEKDGKYVLKIEGIPEPEDLEGLKRKNQEFMEEAKVAKRKAKELEEQARQKEEENARKNGNIEALEKSWQEKLTKREAELLEQSKALESQVYQLTVGQTASTLANELAVSGCSSVLLPHITGRLQVETVDGQVKVRVLDAQGKPSAATIDDLKKEFRDNPAFKPLIAASHASGGGANGANSGGGAAKKPSEMSLAERAEWQARDPAGFEQARANGDFNNY
ncbi:hypothetical protein [Acinetobacter radioresistens]|uniref:hypothetical protein n=1 Tax=Acinetobacter radioresistens TaxID=40216 RepID=UPI00148D1C84|nr:hypothetical protein [Acinetobacter radioresistens]